MRTGERQPAAAGKLRRGSVVTASHSAFVAGTSHAATVTARDAAGNAMPAPADWSFTTANSLYRVYLPVVVRKD